jgi:NhaC family Na+:H+ antiporter
MGIAVSMDLNPAIAAAAVISGAYVGDTSSPLSDSANLAAAAAEVDLYDHIRETAVTSGLSLIIALAVFWFLGQPGAFDASEKMAALQSVFHPTLLLFVPLLVVLALAILKFPPFSTIFLGALTGALLAVIVAPERVIAFADAGDGISRPFLLLKGVWLALASGYKSETGYAMIDQLVTRGGMESMLNTIWLVITALAFGGVVEKAGIIERLITPVIKVAKSAGSLVASTVGAVLATNIVTADQFIAIVLPGGCSRAPLRTAGLHPWCCHAPSAPLERPPVRWFPGTVAAPSWLPPWVSPP